MQSISTGGWDTIYAVRLTALNRMIAAQIASGKLKFDSVNQSGVFGTYCAPVTALELIGDPGEAGTNVAMRITLGPGTVDAVPVGAVAVLGTADLQQLEDTDLVKILLKPPEMFTATSVSGEKLSGMQNGAITDAINNFIKANPTTLSLALASIDKQSPLRLSLPWLSPVAVRHCVSGGKDAHGDAERGTVFAVLAMTSPFMSANPTPPATFDGALLSDADDGAFLLSSAKFTRHVLFPGIANGLFRPDPAFTDTQLQDCERDHLSVDEAACAVRMRTGSPPIALKTMTVDVSPLYGIFASAITMPIILPEAIAALGGTVLYSLIEHQSPNLLIPVTVELQSVEIARSGSKFTFTTNARCELNLGSVNLAIICLTNKTDYQLVMQENGAMSFFAIEGSAFTSAPDVSAPDWLQKLGNLGEVVAIVTGVMATVLTEGNASVMVGLTIALISAELKITPQLVAKELGNSTGVSLPAELDTFLVNAVAPVTWLDGGTFSNPSLRIDDDLAITGAFNTST